MTECDVCHAKTDLRLCHRCQQDLKDTLTQLANRTATNHATGETRPAPGWLELLEDAALGRTRLGESARRSTEHSTPMPVNLTASQLLADVHAMLQRWTETININSETLAIAEQELT